MRARRKSTGRRARYPDKVSFLSGSFLPLMLTSPVAIPGTPCIKDIGKERSRSVRHMVTNSSCRVNRDSRGSTLELAYGPNMAQMTSVQKIVRTGSWR